MSETSFQQRLLDKLRAMPNQMGSVTELAASMRTSRLAVYSSARALHRKGLVVQWVYQADGEPCQKVAYRNRQAAPAEGGAA